MQREIEWEWTGGIYYLESTKEGNIFEKTTVLFLWTSNSTLKMFYMLKSFFDDKPGKIYNESPIKSLTNEHCYSPPHSSISKYVRNNLVQKYKN